MHTRSPIALNNKTQQIPISFYLVNGFICDTIENRIIHIIIPAALFGLIFFLFVFCFVRFSFISLLIKTHNSNQFVNQLYDFIIEELKCGRHLRNPRKVRDNCLIGARAQVFLFFLFFLFSSCCCFFSFRLLNI